MSKQILRQLLTDLGVRPNRRLGQSFLIDPNLLDLIVRTADIQPGGTVVEFGPGTGILTEALAAAGAQVTAVEYDRRLAEYLKTRFADTASVTVIEGDACRVELPVTTGTSPWWCVSNLPYAVTSPLVIRLLESPNPPRRMTLMVQAEAAARFAAPPSCRDYGALSIRIQTMYSVEKVRSVPPDVFWPAPAVDSALITMELKAERPDADSWKALSRIVRHAFRHRRKKFSNAMTGLIEADRVNDVLLDMGVDPFVRPGHLSVEQYVELSKRLEEE